MQIGYQSFSTRNHNGKDDSHSWNMMGFLLFLAPCRVFEYIFLEECFPLISEELSSVTATSLGQAAALGSTGQCAQLCDPDFLCFLETKDI